jgi:hypothetical protein
VRYSELSDSRVPSATARRIERLRPAGRLWVRRGRVVAVGEEPTGLRVRIEQGPPLRGQLYETTEIPEIRDQAAALAGRLVATRARAAPGSAALGPEGAASTLPARRAGPPTLPAAALRQKSRLHIDMIGFDHGSGTAP